MSKEENIQFFETNKYRPRATKADGAGYWIDADKVGPQKVLREAKYKDYHPNFIATYHKCEVHENRPEMLQCDKVMKDLDACLKKYVPTSGNVKDFKLTEECKPAMESFKKSCGIRRLAFVPQLYTVFRYDII